MAEQFDVVEWAYDELDTGPGVSPVSGGAVTGWLLGASIGPGTLLVIFLLGPLVDVLSARVAAFNIHANAAQQSGQPRGHMHVKELPPPLPVILTLPLR